MKAIKHGTYSGYQAEKRSGLKTCDECRSANAAYLRKYRETHSKTYATEKAKHAARARALWLLAERHPDEFRALAAEEIARATA